MVLDLYQKLTNFIRQVKIIEISNMDTNKLFDFDSIQDYYIRSKHHMSTNLQEKFAKTYHDLRINIVKNVFDQADKTGFVWEQYNDETGSSKS